MGIPDIVEFENLISDILDNNKNHVDIERKRLSAPGENYGSLILAIKITIQTEENEEVTVHNLVAKVVPPNEFLKQFMNISYTFRNEYGFYKTLLPCLRKFQEEQGSKMSLDFFPKFYGGRLSLDPLKNTADDDAVMLLENLKEQGFVMMEREVGFDLDTSKLILAKLAELHGTSLALKILRPELFEEKFMPFFEEYRIFEIGGDFITSDGMINTTLNLIKDNELCFLHQDKIKEAIERSCEIKNLPRNNTVIRKGLFTTFIHGDVWINNILIKTHNNKVTDVKFVDLQLYEYHSITKDVLFFIFTSVQSSVLRNSLDDLIHFYFDNLIDTMKKLQCDTTKFTLQDFMDEMKQTAYNQEYYHVMSLMYLVYADEDTVWGADVMDEKKFQKQVRVSEEAKKKGAIITREFIQRGWI